MKARPAKAPRIPAHPGVDVLADEVVWDGRFPLQRVRFRYTRFDGAPSRELTWELWRRGRGCAVLPYDPVSDRLALIEQFRLPALAAGLPPIMVECAAGLVEEGEDPEATARREIVEETGLRPDRFERIGRFMLMQGGCDETMFYYAARVSLPGEGTEGEAAGTPTGAPIGTPIGTPPGTHGLVAEGEDIRVLVLPAEEAFAMLDANRIENVTAAVCLYWLRQNRPRLRRDWA